MPNMFLFIFCRTSYTYAVNGYSQTIAMAAEVPGIGYTSTLLSLHCPSLSMGMLLWPPPLSFVYVPAYPP